MSQLVAAVPPPGCALAGERLRVIVSSDIGGTDPDDFQSMVHLLVYADLFDIEGLVSSPWGAGRADHFKEVIGRYAEDLPSLRRYSAAYPDGEALAAVVKQGALEPAPAAGYSDASEGSDWIVHCARRDDARPLHLLVWGGIDDLAQALHDAPDILPRLRVHFIGGPNKKWSPDAYHYIATRHPALWCIESNATYRGWFTGGQQQGEWGNRAFVERHVAPCGALGAYFATQLEGCIKMGDTPSLARLIWGVPEDPGADSWGGRFVRAWQRPSTRYTRLTTAADETEVFGIVELVLAADAPAGTPALLEIGNQQLRGQVLGDGSLRFRLCPKDAMTYDYTLSCPTLPLLHGLRGQFSARPARTAQMKQPSPQWPHWWTDDLDPEQAEQGHVGARSVSRWRQAFLADFARRMARCRRPA